MLELYALRDRHGKFSTTLFEPYAGSEKALVAAIADMPRSEPSVRASAPSPLRLRTNRAAPLDSERLPIAGAFLPASNYQRGSL
jgi:hypothetical protein